MKLYKILILFSVGILLFGCSQEVLDEINEDQTSTNPTEMVANNLVPDMILKSAYETTGTDIAWYSTVFIEHNAGTWAQLSDADKRNGLESASLMNNSWNAIYDVMNICQTIIDKTDPDNGEEAMNTSARGLAQILMAYNLAVTTDMWGDVPYTEAFKGAENLKPSYDEASTLYPEIQRLLDEAIDNLSASSSIDADDYIYGGNIDNWIRAAYSLKARFHLRLTNVNGTTAAQDALDALANGFTSADQDMLFQEYAGIALPNANPWGEYWYYRDHNSISTTFFNILSDRNDPRIPYLVWPNAGEYVPAPIGEAEETQGGYSQSRLSTRWSGWSAPTPMITYHEIKFIEAEAKFRTGEATWTDALQTAIEEAFAYIGTQYYGAPIPGATDYYTNEVEPLLTAGNELQEILTQKYIAMFEAECIESYNDYRRTSIPTMQNPNNQTVGFPHRFPYALSEERANPDNVPEISIYDDKIWWAAD